MDRILDELERMIGRRPAQYVLPIGRERRWNPDTEGWESPVSDGDAVAPAASALESAVTGA
jgi:hypothetical protein